MGLPVFRTIVFLATLTLLVGLTPPLFRWWRAAELLSGLSSQHRGASEQGGAQDLFEQDLALPLAGRSVRARVYRTGSPTPGPGLVLAHGVHHAGIDERRLVPFARQLARAGFTVLTPELGDLADYRITQDSLDVLIDAVRYLGDDRELCRDRKVGLMGFSFAGGLSLVAATDPRLEDRLAFVTSVGGHHDLERVLHFFTRNTIDTPHGVATLRAHEYGLAVLIYDNLDHFVPAEDGAVMRRALKAWLKEDRAGALAWASLRHRVESEQLFQLLSEQRLYELGPALEAVIAERRAELDALSSRGKLSQTRVPIHLLHGTGDTVIPPSETEWAAAELESAPHDALVSPLLEHVEVNREAGWTERLKLVGFVAAML